VSSCKALKLLYLTWVFLSTTCNQTDLEAVFEPCAEGVEGMLVPWVTVTVPLMSLAVVVNFVLQGPVVGMARVGSILLIIPIIPAGTSLASDLGNVGV
jgi:hypothetical protein